MSNEPDAGEGVTPSPPAGSDPGSGSAPSGDAGDTEFALNDAILGDDLDEIAAPSPQAAPEGAEPAPAPAASPPTAPATPVAQAAPPVAPAQAQVAPTGAPAPRQPAAADLSSMGPDRLAEELSSNRSTLIDHIAQTRFGLTQQEKDALETDAVAAIPKLLARVYFEAATTALNQISSHVPRIVEGVTANLQKTSNVENAFYSKYPAINRLDASHASAVQMAANVFRANNPNATSDQAIDMVGKMAMAMLNLQAPVTNGGQTNGARRPPAFAPAGAGARPVSATPVAKPAVNPFDGLGSYFDEQP